MLRDKYTVTYDFDTWLKVCAAMKAMVNSMLENTAVNSSERLLVIATIRNCGIRLDRRLVEYKPNIRFTLNQTEALAYAIAYRNRWLMNTSCTIQLFEIIDRTL